MKIARFLFLLVILFLTTCSTPTATFTPTALIPTPVITAPTVSSTSIPTVKPTEITTITIPTPIIDTVTPSTEPTVPVPPTGPALFSQFEIGINVAGAEFGSNIPGELGKDYIYPGCEDIMKWTKSSKNIYYIRYPIRIERLFQDGALTEEKNKIHEVLSCSSEGGFQIILDAHNYARINDNGTERFITPEELKSFWATMAEEFGEFNGLAGYDLMNEPNQMLSNTQWLDLAQAGIDGIRQHDSENSIFVQGDFWSHTDVWPQYSHNLTTLKDSASNLIYEGHVYFDPDGSGQYTCGTAETCGIKPEVAVDRLQPFVEWCNTNQARCIVGEMGVPTEDESWKPVIQEAFFYLKQHDIPVFLWAAGPWWGDYPLSLENGGEWIFELAK